MKKHALKDIQFIEIPTIMDSHGSGNLSFIQSPVVPFEIKRVYYLYDVPTNAYRGAHSHKAQYEMLIALSGSFDIVLDDGQEKKRFLMKTPNRGLLIPPGIWRELDQFSSGAVCLVLNSDLFDESDYIREYDAFLISKNT